MKKILCLVLGVYSVALITYAASEIYKVQACTAGCYKGETAFGSGTSRQVNVNVRTSGTDSVPAGLQGKVTTATNTAMGNWNGATDNTGTTSPYNFQNAGSNTPNVNIVFVEDLKSKNGREVCAQLETTTSQTGQIQSATLYLKRKVVEDSTDADLAELIQHELGHFIGLADFYGKAEQCQTTMAQAKSGCTTGLQGSQAISQNDVANVKKYVNNATTPGQCKRERKSTPVVGGGPGYTDPNPAPIFYPRTCYYFYDAIDLYWCYDGCQYIGTVYYLTDVFCTY